jgi:uncharacterized protein YndB with AHSA1/START domain
MTEHSDTGVVGTLHSLDGRGVVRMRCRCETDINDLWSAITDPARLARWYGKVEGDFEVGGEFTAFVFMSGWEGVGKVDVCEAPRRLSVSMRENDGHAHAHVTTAELESGGARTTLVIECRGVPLDVVWAYGAGWNDHVESLLAHLAGNERADWPTPSQARFDELAPQYQAMTVVPLDH